MLSDVSLYNNFNNNRSKLQNSKYLLLSYNMFCFQDK